MTQPIKKREVNRYAWFVFEPRLFMCAQIFLELSYKNVCFILNSAYHRWAVFSRVTLAILAQNLNK